MWPYWLMFVLPAAMALVEARRGGRRAGEVAVRVPMEWWGVGLVFALLIGWRHEVGGDWFNYARLFESVVFQSQFREWWLDDPGYRLLEFLADRYGWGIHGVNLIAGALFSGGLVWFCRHLPRPWLALAVSVPYLVIILGMGYSRQGIALGLLMVGLVALGNAQVGRFVFWSLLGALFHKSAVLVLPLAALAATRRRTFTIAWVGIAGALAYVLLLQDSVEDLQQGYLEAEYQSQGALIRLAMNAVPAALLLWKRERFTVSLPQERLWFWFAVSAFVLLAAYYFSPSSTAVDRVALYVLPLQLMVFSFVPEVLGKKKGRNELWVGAVLVYYAAVEYVWLNYATHAHVWIPYRFYPLEW